MEQKNNSVDAAAQVLAAARQARKPGPRLPESCRPADIESAFAVQRAVTRLTGLAIGGWKCSLPSPGKVMAAPIYAPDIVRTSPCFVPGESGAARIEPEIAFVMKRDLGPRTAPYTEAEVRAAIASTHLVLELIGNRVADVSELTFPEKLADGLSNFGLFVGPILEGAFGRPLSEMPLVVDGVLTRDGRHPDGNPLPPLVWLANFLRERGESLTAGQVVTTGSYAGVLDLPFDTPLAIRFGDLGSINVEFHRLDASAV